MRETIGMMEGMRETIRMMKGMRETIGMMEEDKTKENEDRNAKIINSGMNSVPQTGFSSHF